MSRAAISWSGTTFIYAALLFACYLLAGELSYTFSNEPALVTVHVGIALVGLLLGGLAFAPVVLLASIASLTLHEMSLLPALIVSLSITLEVAAIAFVLRRLGFSNDFRGTRDTVLFLLAAIVGSAIVPVLAWAVSIWSDDMLMPHGPGALWVGHFLVYLVVVPLVLLWRRRPVPVSASIYIERALIFAAIGGASWVLFFNTVDHAAGVYLLLFQLVPFLMLALRHSPRWVALGLALMFGAAITGPGGGLTIFGNLTQGELLLRREVLLAIVGSITYIVAALTEERRRALFDLKSQVGRAEQALERISADDRAKSDFIAILAHELRNPLAPVVTHLELIKSLAPGKEVEASVRAIEESMTNAGRLLQDILDVSRISQRKFQLTKGELVLGAAIENALLAVAAAADARGIRISIEVPSTPVAIMGDKMRLEQVLTNLLNNSIKYGKEGGSVHVSLAEEREAITIRVKDDGIGIREDLLEKIFEPFVQGNSEAVGGMGVGLYLSKQFVELHGGHILAKSEGRGRGSELVITLPNALKVREPSLIVPAREVPLKERKTDRPRRVLIVDDLKEAAESLARLLAIAGHKTEVAFDGAEALGKVRTFAPDFVFLDIRMPGADGYAIARQMRREGVRAKLVALTGYGQIDDKKKARDAGFDHHLTKPADFRDMLEILRESEKASVLTAWV